MKVSVADLKKLFAPMIPEEAFSRLDPGLPLAGQGVDSLALTGLAVALENVYRVTITPEDGIKLKTLDDIVAFLDQAGAAGK